MGKIGPINNERTTGKCGVSGNHANNPWGIQEMGHVSSQEGVLSRREENESQGNLVGNTKKG